MCCNVLRILPSREEAGGFGRERLFSPLPLRVCRKNVILPRSLPGHSLIAWLARELVGINLISSQNFLGM